MSIHTRPTRRLGAAALTISLAACGQQLTSPPPSPLSPAPAPPPTAGVTVSGTAIEFTASGKSRPVPNLRLKVWKPGPRVGAVGGVELGDTVTDAGGRYTMTDVPAVRELFFQTAPASDYRFLCDFHPVLVDSKVPPPGFSLSDLPVVHAGWSGNQLPPGMWTVGTSVYGTVSERVDGSLQPVAGATVSLDGGLHDPPATTSASGFYMICSTVGTDVTRDITAQKTGYIPGTRQILGGWDFEAHLELARR